MSYIFYVICKQFTLRGTKQRLSDLQVVSRYAVEHHFHLRSDVDLLGSHHLSPHSATPEKYPVLYQNDNREHSHLGFH